VDRKPGAAAASAPDGYSVAGLIASPKVWSSVVLSLEGAFWVGVISSVTPDKAARRRAAVLIVAGVITRIRKEKKKN
jgi:hypothetical protein